MIWPWRRIPTMLTWRVCYRRHRFRRWCYWLMQSMPQRLQLSTAPPHRPIPLPEAEVHLLAIVGKAAPHYERRAARIFSFFCPDGVALTRQLDVSPTCCCCTRERNPIQRDDELELHRPAGARRQSPLLRGAGHRTAVSYSCLRLPPVLIRPSSLLSFEPLL